MILQPIFSKHGNLDGLLLMGIFIEYLIVGYDSCDLEHDAARYTDPSFIILCASFLQKLVLASLGASIAKISRNGSLSSYANYPPFTMAGVFLHEVAHHLIGVW